MVEKFKKILAKMKLEKGNVFIFALLKMDELTDKWSVILSAPWAEEDDSDTFKYVFNLIESELTSEEFSSIARVGIFPKTDYFVEFLLKHGISTPLTNEKINGTQVHEGYIIESNPEAKESAQQKLVQ